MPVAPAWSIHKGRLYVAPFPQIIQSALENGSGKSLVKSPEFMRIRSKLSADATVITYTDTPKMIRQLYGIYMFAWTMGANAGAAASGLPLRPDWLPALSKIEKYLWPHASAISHDPYGIILESYSSIPTPQLGVQSVPMMVSILIPAVNEAKNKAKKTVAMARLKNIHTAIALYSMEYDKYPNSLADLVDGDDELITPDQLVSPISGRKTPQVKDGKFVGEIDFVYTLAGKNAAIDDVSGDMIMLYERPENYKGKGTNVVYADGSRQWMDIKEFDRALARQNSDGDDF